ncbi:hypothetical protein EPK99_16125 [Neorhizobium lilium]|uniref:Uncharacterized protein n=1 Tax=Neorhizobium lilium TaxID=2503024 RepID=A0A444LG64_9HYPH|nr:plant virulence effector HPE1-like domain-containing protein [Neorhizobium lilium]RWX77174.1 hypothetical protein EPK99_16125 [Neorhizobium lilium]
MRLVLTIAFAAASGSAFSASITTLSGTPANVPSIIQQHCTDCPAPTPKVDRSTYHVPSLASGTQTTEIRDIKGEKKIVRTEAWLGGSPVIYISKLPDWEKDDTALAGVRPPAGRLDEKSLDKVASPADGIDLNATTSAVDATSASQSGALALDHFDLRLQDVN